MKKIILALLVLKIVVSLIHTAGPFVHPHIIRQVDTMGMSLRYWLRWTVEDENSNKVLPAVLAAGDGEGITPSEFPILNILVAPVFELDLEIARVAGRLLLLLLSLLVLYGSYRAWSGVSIAGVDMKMVVLMTPLLGIHYLYFGKFIPDVLAYQLCFFALGLSWERPSYLKSGSLLVVGLLMKPTAIAVMILLLFKGIRNSIKHMPWIIPGIILMFVYYTYGVEYISQFTEQTFFRLGNRSVMAELVEIAEEPEEVVRLFNNLLFYPFFPIVFLVTVVANRVWNKDFKLLLSIFFLDLVVMTLISGSHAMDHSYYIVGVTPLCAMIFLFLLNSVNKKWKWFLFLPLIVWFLEYSFYEVAPVFDSSRSKVAQLWESCRMLKKRHPEIPWSSDFRLRTKFTKSASLGFCFGNIQNSKSSKWGVYEDKKDIPPECQVIDQEQMLLLTKCGQ